MITKQTAYEICCAYNEIEHGKQLLIDLDEAAEEHGTPEIRDVFGRLKGLQLGVPTSTNSHRLFDVAPELGRQIIKTHIAQKEAELAVLNERARAELL